MRGRFTSVTGSATSRSLRRVLPFSVCFAVSTPMRRAVTRQPGAVGAPMSSRTSRASPSSARVPGMEPKSNGNACPAGRIWLRRKQPRLRSYFSLEPLPRGVSTITFTRPFSRGGIDAKSASIGFIRRASGAGEVLLLHLVGIELAGALAHGFQHLLERRRLPLKPAQRIDARDHER